jgi:hypothetical protein
LLLFVDGEANTIQLRDGWRVDLRERVKRKTEGIDEEGKDRPDERE